MNANSSDRQPCDHSMLEHPRYFPRQMMTVEEMTLEHNYFRDKLRRHNRLLHGWGVVCGAKVCAIASNSGTIEPWKVKVEPGYILGPYGDEIVLDCDRVVNLRTSGVTGITGDTTNSMSDPWCSEVFVERHQGPLFIAVKYKEIMARPVRVQPVGCGCDNTQCEYSRWQDGYEIGILTSLPKSHQGSPPEKFSNKELLKCPPCPSEPWVVLAELQIDDNGVIKEIDNCSPRRLVFSLAPYWWQCLGGQITIDTLTAIPNPILQGQEGTIEVTGNNFAPGAKVNLGDISIQGDITVEPDGKKLSFKVKADPTATPGARTLIVTNPDCSMAIKAGVISIKDGAINIPSPGI